MLYASYRSEIEASRLQDLNADFRVNFIISNRWTFFSGLHGHGKRYCVGGEVTTNLAKYALIVMSPGLQAVQGS